MKKICKNCHWCKYTLREIPIAVPTENTVFMKINAERVCEFFPPSTKAHILDSGRPTVSPDDRCAQWQPADAETIEERRDMDEREKRSIQHWDDMIAEAEKGVVTGK